MLDSKILDFARQLIQADIKKRQRSFFDELSRKKRELHLSGNSPGTSSSGKKIIRNIFTKELESRAHFAWRSLQRAHKAVGSQPTETLAYDFKEAVAHFLDEIKKELSEFMMKQPGFTKDDTANSTLDSAKNDACEKIDIEIDLYVSNLQSHITQKMNSGEKEYDRIVELLRKDYLLKTEDDVKQKVATAAQIMVDRGLSNSTVSINAQLKPRFEQIKNLFDYLIDSLQNKFAYIPLGKFRNKLLVIAQEEYKRLSSVPTALLVQAGLTSQDLIKQYAQKIKQEMSKTKTRIETQCAISESKIHGEKQNEGNAIRAHKPWYKRIWAIVAGLIIFLAALTTLILNLNKIKENIPQNDFNKTTTESKYYKKDENIFSRSPKEICEDIRSKPVFQQEDTAKYYTGLMVRWRLRLKLVSKLDEKTVSVLMRTDEFLEEQILFTVEISKYPQLKFAKENKLIWVSGEIKKINPPMIQLSDVSLVFE